MKKTYILILAFVSLVAFTACETDYDEYETERLPVVGLTGTVGSQNVSLDPGDSEEKGIEVYVSDVSSEDRSFPVEANLELTEIDAANYTLPASFVVPAGSRTAEFTITVTNVNLPVEYGAIVLKVADGAGHVAGSEVGVRARLKP
tara:strand:+ start:45961 stop:46398 length:438 start_codon:yes stop_codon:yes gene_type:complete